MCQIGPFLQQKLAHNLGGMSSVAVFCIVGGVAAVIFAALWLSFWVPRRLGGSFYFDPQDSFANNTPGRKFPKSAATGTFEPMLKSYIEVMKLLVTVAAASIAFGGGGHSCTAIVVAKLLLAWSIFSGILFCAFLLFRYDEYAQDVTSYTPKWYATIFAFGFCCLFCFISGYLAWAFGLIKC
jgi:hypothetical protein